MKNVLTVNFLSQVIFVFLLVWGMVMYANDIETNGKQKLPEIKKLISSLDFLCYSIRSTMSLELLSTIIGCTCVSVRIQEGWINLGAVWRRGGGGSGAVDSGGRGK